MTEDQEKGQSEQASHSPEDAPPDNIDAQREEAKNPSPQNPASDQPSIAETAPTPARATPVTAQAPASPELGESQEEGDVPQDAPEGYEPQVDLQPDQAPGIEERPGEQVTDVEEEENDQTESPADQNDDEAVDEPDPGTSG